METKVQIKLNGWRARKVENLDFYRCPGCRHTQESIFYGDDRMAPCYNCNNNYPVDSFGTAKVRRVVAECQDCGADISLTPRNFSMSGIGWLCSDCNNYVAVVYGTRKIDPKEGLDPNWNADLQEHAQPVGENNVFLRCKTKKDLLIVRLLQVTAKEEDPRFLFARDADQNAGLYFDTARQKYLGFIVWTQDDEYAVLRQIYIVPDERKKGLGEKLLSYWVKRYADNVNDTFGIEAPNEQAIQLHIKLGHIVREGDSLKGVKCFCVPSM
jgi:GNAT superfamily N-acetyltransferase